ncbi:MAG: hypothetical protein MJZ70_07930, partial [Bacteroidales bacterium]|nr:hypothetical protein [Bacteroidales bacterium]
RPARSAGGLTYREAVGFWRDSSIVRAKIISLQFPSNFLRISSITPKGGNSLSPLSKVITRRKGIILKNFYQAAIKKSDRICRTFLYGGK